ncbi:MAG: hypothetical protein QM650_18655 [Microlunatus sp.]
MTGQVPGADGARAADPLASYAMLSVYYASIDDQFTVSGAPSVAIPPEVKPLPLADALAILAKDPQRLAQAIWQVVRTSPIRQAGEKTSRYPAELDAYLSPADQEELDRVRVDYRSGASLVAACLRACHHDDRPLFNALSQAAQDKRLQRNHGFKEVVRLLFNEEPDAFITRVSKHWDPTRQEITGLEHEVGLNIATYVEQLAATAAYRSFVESLPRWHNKTMRAPLTVYPVSSVIKQSTEQLWTMATVTTLATGRYRELLTASDPAHWHDGSDVIKQSDYISDPMRPLEPDESQTERAPDFRGLLYEVATMAWGGDKTQQAEFCNVLNIERTVRKPPAPERPTIEVGFSLSRSISSSVLWDDRSGGITMNEGYLRVSPLGRKSWRITSRKLLRFSDRTPYSGGSGLTDFGQMLNYLAPAALSWWVETETYSLGKRAAAREQATSTDGSKDGRHG